MTAPAVIGDVVPVRPVRHSERARKREVRWNRGVCLGGEPRTRERERLVGTPEGVVRALAIRRGRDCGKWNSTAIEELKGTPGSCFAGKEDEQIPTPSPMYRRRIG